MNELLKFPNVARPLILAEETHVSFAEWQLGVFSSYMRRLLRFTLPAPDIVEAIIDGNEPDGFSQNMLVAVIPADWKVQQKIWGFQN